jgi:replicative DNA helicase
MTTNRKQTNKTIDSSGYGKIPPQAIEIEDAIIGACLLEKGAIDLAKRQINSDCFYSPKNQLIFIAMEELNKKSSPIDILTVTNQLKQDGKLDEVGGPFAITQITNRVAGAANMEYHCKIVLEKYILRTIITESTILQQEAFTDSLDPLEMLSETSKALDRLYQMILNSKEVTFKEQVIDAHRQIMNAKQGGKSVFGLETGFPIHDLITSGRIPGTLTILGARPSMGKTTRMLQEVYNIAIKQNKPVGVASLETPAASFIMKFLSNMTSIDNRAIRNGQYDSKHDETVSRAAEELAKKNIFLCDDGNIHIDKLRAKALVWKKKYGIVALYVDYLQLITGDKPSFGGNRDQEIGSISRGLKRIAMDLSIPVIALSQLSRTVDARKPKPIPLLSDLRESGNIEQDADVVEFLYRPDYYEEDPVDGHNRSLKGLVQSFIAKNRDGALDSTYNRFIKEYSRFEEVDVEKYFEDPTYITGKQNPIIRNPSEPNYTIDPDEDTPF